MSFNLFREKMEKEGLSPSSIAAFEHSFQEMVNGSAGPIREDSIRPVDKLVSLSIFRFI